LHSAIPFIAFAELEYIARLILVCTMAKRDNTKTHAYSAQRSGSKKYAKAERRKRHKAR
jgi:hypothetical protein